MNWEKIAGWSFAAIASLIVIAGIGNKLGLDANTWPAWVQAIGSIAAILAAVWVSYDQQTKQTKRDEERERDDLRHMLQSIRDELWITYTAAKERNGKLIEESKAGTPFFFKIPFTDRPFPIFNSCVSKLGRIPDDELRKLIIVGHGRARGLVLSVIANNGLVEKFEYADYMARAMKDDVHQQQRSLIEQQMCAYGDALRKLHKEACQSIEEMVTALDTYLAKA
jgi:hypothetical protein